MAPSIPDRWMNYKPYGTVIKDTKILAFKVPLKPTVVKALLPEQQFTTRLLMQSFPKLKFVIDLTHTARYYSKQDFIDAGVGYQKILVEGKKIPNMACAKQFFKTMDNFFASAKDDELIGVHCTHGLNRTGYLVCRYLVQQLGWNLENAIEEFEKARGHEIERKEYIEALKSVPKNKKMDTSGVVLHADPLSKMNNKKQNNKRQPPRRGDHNQSNPSARFDYNNPRNYERQRDYYPVRPPLPPLPPSTRLPMPHFSDHHNNYQYNHHNHGRDGPMPGPYLPPPLLPPAPLPLLPPQFDDIPHVGPPNEPATFFDRRFNYRGVPYPFVNEPPRRPVFLPKVRPSRAGNVRQMNFENDIVDNNFCEFTRQEMTNSRSGNRPKRNGRH